jgi:hypothetical protein
MWGTVSVRACAVEMMIRDLSDGSEATAYHGATGDWDGDAACGIIPRWGSADQRPTRNRNTRKGTTHLQRHVKALLKRKDTSDRVRAERGREMSGGTFRWPSIAFPKLRTRPGPFKNKGVSRWDKLDRESRCRHHIDRRLFPNLEYGGRGWKERPPSITESITMM